MTPRHFLQIDYSLFLILFLIDKERKKSDKKKNSKEGDSSAMARSQATMSASSTPRSTRWISILAWRATIWWWTMLLSIRIRTLASHHLTRLPICISSSILCRTQPIELFWKAVKQRLKRSTFKDTETLMTCITEASDMLQPVLFKVTVQHFVNCFVKCKNKEPL